MGSPDDLKDTGAGTAKMPASLLRTISTSTIPIQRSMFRLCSVARHLQISGSSTAMPTNWCIGRCNRIDLRVVARPTMCVPEMTPPSPARTGGSRL